MTLFQMVSNLTSGPVWRGKVKAELERALTGASERILEMVREMDRRDDLIAELYERIRTLETVLGDREKGI
ncbi:hypothetical protein GGE65_008359 [Skermanella aerolata]|uniref:hypothetical protein n=1 Tax=Skermanella aerolata TaxID=393310 RepID=UPI003D20AB0E